MRKNFSALFVLAVALVISSGCKMFKSGSPTGPTPTNGGIAQIQRVDVSIPSGTVSQNGEGLDITLTVWVLVDLPDREYVSLQYCFSAEREMLTHGCAMGDSLVVAALRAENPLRIRIRNGGYGGNPEPTVIRYIHVLVFRGLDLRRYNCGRGVPCPIPTDTIARETIEWTMTFM